MTSSPSLPYYLGVLGGDVCDPRFIYVAFYKGRTRLTNRVISWWLGSPYSHVELILGIDQIGRAVCASSSMMDDGVRIKHIALHPEHWDVLPVYVDDAELVLARAWDWLDLHNSEQYDYRGLTSFVIRKFGHDPAKSTCATAVAGMLGVADSSVFEPRNLHALLSWTPDDRATKQFAEILP